jgi:hypothetical protein
VQLLNARCKLSVRALTMTISRIQNLFRQLYTRRSSNKCEFIILKAHFMEVKPLDPHLNRDLCILKQQQPLLTYRMQAYITSVLLFMKVNDTTCMGYISLAPYCASVA